VVAEINLRRKKVLIAPLRILYYPEADILVAECFILTGRLSKQVKVLVLNTDSDLMANMYIVLNYRRKLLEHAYGYYGMELKLAFSSL
jgi:hypothetical protein